MNQAFLRPPLPLFRIAAFAASPLLVWLSCYIALSRLGPLQTLYWSDYVRTSLPSTDMVPSFGAKKEKREYQILLCSEPVGRKVPLIVDGRPIPNDARLAAIPMSTADFHTWLFHDIYGGRLAAGFLLIPVLVSMFLTSLLAGAGYLLDQQRRVAFRSTPRHLSGPRLLTPSEFNRRVQGDGVGFYVERGLGLPPQLLRIERSVEAQHQLLQGDNGAGKTIAMFGLADQFEGAGETCVYYDPECQFLRRYWKPGDLILGPDQRSASYSPSDEIDFSSTANAEASALAQAESLYPCRPGVRDFFFWNSARMIYKHCVVNYRPNAAQLAQLYTHADPLIDAIAKGSEIEEMLAKNTQGLRASIVSTLTQCLFALQQIPGEESGRPKFSAREYVGLKGRRPSIFLTSGDEKTQAAFSPLHRLWIDSLIREFLSLPEVPPGQIVVRMFIDELPALGELPTLKSAASRGRKHGIDLVLGFQGRSQLKAIYGEEAEAIFSAPFTKLLLHTGEPEGGDWASKMIGERKVERIVEHITADRKRSYTTQPGAVERIADQSELASLKNRCGYLRYAEWVVKLKLALPPARPDRCVAFLPRTGVAPVQLAMPNLAEILAQEAAEKVAFANRAAGPWKPSKV